MGGQRKRSHLAVRIVDTPTRETTRTVAANRDERRELEGTRCAEKEGDQNEVVTRRFTKKSGKEKEGEKLFPKKRSRSPEECAQRYTQIRKVIP